MLRPSRTSALLWEVTRRGSASASSRATTGWASPGSPTTLGKLKEAGLVREERRGRWSFYSLDRKTAGQLLAGTQNHLGVTRRRNQRA